MLVERSAQRRPTGYSLVEIMVVLTIVGVLAGMAAPTYQRAVEQSRANIAAANLRAIWVAQRLYWLDNHAYASNLTTLRTTGLLDPELELTAGGYAYEVTSAAADAFQATAARLTPSCWTGTFSIDEAGTIGGALHAAGENDITAGFQ